MSQCYFCKKLIKIQFVCPYCRQSFCSDHRKPEDHHCTGIERAKLSENSSEIDETEIGVIDSVKLTSEDNYFEDFSSTEEPSLEIEENLDNIEYKNRIEEIIEDKVEKKQVTIEEEIEKSHDVNNSVFDKLFDLKIAIVSIIVLSIIIGASAGYLLQPKGLEDLKERHNELLDYYTDLVNSTNMLENDYYNLTNKYEEVLIENQLLKNEIIQLEESINEYQEILNNDKKILLAENVTIILEPEENRTIIFEIPFNGIVDLNYTITGNASIQIGSDSLIAQYYYQKEMVFPGETLTVPVQPKLLISFTNKGQQQTEIQYTINFTY